MIGMGSDQYRPRSVLKSFRYLRLLVICYSLSLQVLSGDRYGFRPIPTEISVEEFKIFKIIGDMLQSISAGSVW